MTKSVVVLGFLLLTQKQAKPWLLVPGSWFHLSFKHCDVISMVDKFIDQGFLKPACNMTQNAIIGMR